MILQAGQRRAPAPILPPRRAGIAPAHLAPSHFWLRSLSAAEFNDMETQAVTSSAPNQIRSKTKELQTEDFIKMMVTQLQNQDPMKPASNQELMQQMSQISSMQSSSSLQTLL